MKWQELSTDKLENHRVDKTTIFFFIGKDQEKSGIERIVGIWDVDMGDINSTKREEMLTQLIQTGVRVELVDKGELIRLRTGPVSFLVGENQVVLVVNLELSLTLWIPCGQFPFSSAIAAQTSVSLSDGETLTIFIDPEECGLGILLAQHHVSSVSKTEMESWAGLVVGLEKTDILRLDGGDIRERGECDLIIGDGQAKQFGLCPRRNVDRPDKYNSYQCNDCVSVRGSFTYSFIFMMETSSGLLLSPGHSIFESTAKARK